MRIFSLDLIRIIFVIPVSKLDEQKERLGMERLEILASLIEMQDSKC